MATIQEATQAFLDALTAKELAEEAHDKAKELVIKTYAEAGITESELHELKVMVVSAETRSFDANKLKELVTPAQFRRLTKPKVDVKAWDSAEGKNEIPKRVIKAVVSFTESVRVLVRPAKGAEKPVRVTQTTATLKETKTSKSKVG
jgi:hypothetical protein